MKMFTLFTLSSLFLVACTPFSPTQTHKSVHYQCGAKHNMPLMVNYTFVGENVQKAQVFFQHHTYNDLTPIDSNQEMIRFTNPEGIVWVTDHITLHNVGEKDGMMLYQKEKDQDRILVNYCDLAK